MPEEKDSLDQQMENEELTQKVERQGKGRGLLVGTIIAAAITGAAIAEHYTGFVGKALEGGRGLPQQIGQKAEDAYNGTLTFISDLRTTEAKLGAAQALLREAPLEVRAQAAAEIYRSMPEQEKGAFVGKAMNGTYGDITETFREKMMGGLSEDERYQHAWTAYSGLDNPLQSAFDSMAYASKTMEGRSLSIEKLISGMTDGEVGAVQKTAFSRLPEDSKYEAAREQAIGLEKEGLKQLIKEGAETRFTGPDYVETIGLLYEDSRNRFDNGREVATAILGKHATDIAEKIKQYTHDLLK